MAKSDDEKLLDQATLDFVRNGGNRPIVIETNIHTAMDLIGLVQLGMRHPGVQGAPIALRCEKFCAALIEKIDPAHGDIWRLLNMGFNPRHDQEINNE